MTPEERHLLEETHALAKDNHRMLRSVRRHQIITDFGKFFIWVIIIIGFFYGYLTYLRPAIDQFRATGLITLPNSILNLPSSTELQNLINSYKAKQ